ncbi:MAG: hypothetical protein E7042_06210 [Lentisphaerae bacterium]|nr:hypothetical protein [Lentisphaerota bacterium]
MRFTGITLLITAIAFTAFAAPETTAKTKTAQAKKSVTAKKAIAPKKKINKNQKKRIPPPALVNISVMAPNGGDITAIMLKAIKTRTPQIVFDKPGIYEMQPIALPRQVRIILNDGVTIKALPQKIVKGSKVKALPGLFSANRVKQIHIKGNGNAVIQGGELPVFAFSSSNNLSVTGVTVTGGKCAIDANNCWNFRISDSAFDNVSGEAAIFTAGGWNHMNNVQFRNMPCHALTIVASSNGRIPNMTLDNCEFFNNNTSVKVIAPAKFTIKPVDPKKNPKYRPPRLNFRNCRFFNNSGTDLELYGALDNALVRIENNVFTNPANRAIKFREFIAGNGVSAEIYNTIFRPAKTNPGIPILVHSLQDKPFGNIKFVKTTVCQPVNKKAIAFELKKNQGNIAGTLPVVADDGSVKNAELVMEGK